MLAGTTPFTDCVGVTVNVTPLQVTAVIAVIVALGLKVTVTVNVAPVQTPGRKKLEKLRFELNAHKKFDSWLRIRSRGQYYDQST